eukprot:4742543-Amphidinium_carterae.1
MVIGSASHNMRTLLFAIQKHHLRAGAPDPLAKKTRIWSLLESMKRAAPAPARKLGVTTSMLAWLHDRLVGCGAEGSGERINSIVLWAALVFGFFFLARAGEYLAVHEVDSKKVLRGADVIFKNGEQVVYGEYAERIEVHFRQAKNDQFYFGQTRAHFRITEGDRRLCPVHAMAMLEKKLPHRFRGGSEAHMPLFRWSDGTALQRTEVQNALRKAARALQLPESRIATHSLRIGGASSLFHHTGSLELVRRYGRWSSTTFHRYLWNSAEQAKGLAGAMSQCDAIIHTS